MNIDFIRTFIRLVEYENFSRLADEMGISQSTLSHRISQLEEELGEIKLIDRTTRKFELTAEGKAFLEYARKIVDLYESARAKLTEISSTIREEIIITASTLPGSHILPKYIAKFREDFPNVDFKILINNSRQSLKLISDNNADFGGIGSFMGYKEENFDTLKIGEESLRFVCSPSHDLVQNKGGTVKFEDLKKYPFIAREKGSGTRDIFEKHYKPHEELNAKLEMNDNDSIVSALTDSKYISVLSEIIAQKAEDAGLITFLALKDHPLDVKRDIYLIKRKDLEFTDLKQKFWETLKDSFSL